jgi:hypothetical protein
VNAASKGSRPISFTVDAGDANVKTISLDFGSELANLNTASIASVLRYIVTPSHERNAGFPKSKLLLRKQSRREMVSKSQAISSTFDGTSIPAMANRSRFEHWLVD